MKQKMTRILVLVLALSMVLSMTAFAAGGAQEGTGSSGTLTESPAPSVPSYRVIVEDIQKDKLRPDRTTASAGSTVTIKVQRG